MSADDPEQILHAIEWPTPATHCFYIAYVELPDGMIVCKPGQSKRPRQRITEFGGLPIGWNPCPCALDTDAKGRPKCDAERNWERTFGDARLPLKIAQEHRLPGEIYSLTRHIYASLRWRFRTDDKAMATIDYIERANQRRAS